MDTLVEKLIQSIRGELAGIKKKSDFYRLCIQNHLYGCFVLMELRAESPMEHVGWETNFEKLGIQYGFMDDERLYCRLSDAYRGAWTNIIGFAGIKQEDIDTIESGAFPVVQDAFKGGRDSFFENALDTGELDETMRRRALCVFEDENEDEESSDTETGVNTGSGTGTSSVVGEQPSLVAQKPVEQVVPTPTVEPSEKPGVENIHRFSKTRHAHGRRSITPIQRKHTPRRTRKRFRWNIKDVVVKA